MQIKHQKESIKAGLIESFPLTVSIVATAFSFGILATQANLSVIEAVGMSVLIFSGSVQFITVAMLAAGAGFASILLTSLLFNMRNVLYGVGIGAGLVPAKKWRWLLYHGISDETFVLCSARFKKYGPDPLYFSAVIASFYVTLNVFVLLGALVGNQFDPQKWGLDLAFPITFAALLAPSLKDYPTIATVVAGVMIAFSLEYFWPGNQFTIILTGVLAPFVGLYLHKGAGES